MHRNTYILVSMLAVLTALVVGVNLGKKLTPRDDSAKPTPTIAPSPTMEVALLPFTNNTCGFSVQYDPAFTLLDNASGGAVLSFSSDQSKSIVMTCQKDIPRPPIASGSTQILSLPSAIGASVTATLYHEQSAKDGSPIDAVIFTHPAKKTDIFISGYGDAFNALIKTIQVLP